MGKDELLNGPWLVYISPTNVCNLNCVMCARSKVMRDKQGFMSEEVFRKIVEELPLSVRKVYLMKQGEPFLHPKIEEFIRYLKEKRPDIHISIHTNCVFLTRNRFLKIMDFIDSLGISISSINRETYHKVHGKDNFEKVITNLSEIGSVMSGRKTPYVFIDYVRQPLNEHESEKEIVEFFKQFGVFSVDIHYAHSFHGVIDFVETRLWEDIDERLFPVCIFPWCSVTFLFDGNVSYCFVEAEERIFMGNIMNMHFEQIWNGSLYRLFRKLMVQRKFNELEERGFCCKRCTWLWDLKIQSPRSLIGGYSLGIPCFPSMGDFLKSFSLEEAVEKAVNLYLEGEILLSKAWLNFISASISFSAKHDLSEPYINYTDVVNVINKMISVCELTENKFLPWERIMANMNRKGVRIENKYYKVW